VRIEKRVIVLWGVWKYDFFMGASCGKSIPKFLVSCAWFSGTFLDNHGNWKSISSHYF